MNDDDQLHLITKPGPRPQGTGLRPVSPEATHTASKCRCTVNLSVPNIAVVSET